MANSKLLFSPHPIFVPHFPTTCSNWPMPRGTTPSDKNTSPFDFIKKLKGCHKGNHTKEVHELKSYVEKFGYLKYPNGTHADDDFDKTLESAVKTYQKNYHIKPSGIVDVKTISTMTTPRCGVPDIENGTNYMQLRQKKRWSSNTLHTVAPFSFFPGELPRTSHRPGGTCLPEKGCRHALHLRTCRSHQNSDLVIEFHRRQHGDDGPGGVLAHAFSPPEWMVPLRCRRALVYCWGSQCFRLGNDRYISMKSDTSWASATARLEKQSCLLPFITKNLHADDINGINALYR